MAPTKPELGPSTKTVAENITRYRKRAGLTLRGVAEELTAHGHPTSHSVISQMENMGRRIDVDDLSRLAYVLDCSVAALLTPHVDDPDEEVGTTAAPDDTARSAVARIYRESPAMPTWIVESVDRVTGAKRRITFAALELVERIATTTGAQDVETAVTLAYGNVLRQQESSRDRGDD